MVMKAEYKDSMSEKKNVGFDSFIDLEKLS
jgi:hypothetical protein